MCGTLNQWQEKGRKVGLNGEDGVHQPPRTYSRRGHLWQRSQADGFWTLLEETDVICSAQPEAERKLYVGGANLRQTGMRLIRASGSYGLGGTLKEPSDHIHPKTWNRRAEECRRLFGK
ncbi:conserved hypothetical protein [Culex quinquefasciatus]|uniref:Uncharacterized protein n=1 Tax=Culex quinquefasciatus TaxID=7176 RepID=B0WXY2_CULQU|nr:conserved hypothetical protein [Culex quinquefasciatus]|eukprot:XP_001862254.1 conserved hypothetical protein [Culex quinquefasciatus]